MIITVNTDLYRYEIQALIKAYYPADDVRVLLTGSDKLRRALAHGEHVYATLTYEPECITFTIGDAAHTAAAPAGTDYCKIGPACKEALKHLLYDTLAEETGHPLPWGDLIGVRPTKIASSHLAAGERAEEVREYLETAHRVSAGKAALAVDIAEREARILRPLHYENGYSLYIGIPFCPTTCLYCSFPSNNLAVWEDRVPEYLAALDLEMAATAEMMQGQVLDTVYIGGGTPTTLTADQLAWLIGRLRSYFDMGTCQEFTVEAGRPDSITRDRLAAMREGGVQRISVNPQSMNDAALRAIGRAHTVDDVVRAFYETRDAGFDNINMDIILGLPGEGPDEVRRTMAAIEALHPDSLTVHSLAVKRASRLARVIEERGYPVMINTDETVRIAAESAARMGLEPYYLYRQKQMSGNYENTGYAAPGKAGIYNILIMEEVQSIVALGAGSVSKRVNAPGTPIQRCDNAKDVDTYIRNIAEMIARKRALYTQ